MVRITDDSGPFRVESLADGLGLTRHALGVLFDRRQKREGVAVQTSAIVIGQFPRCRHLGVRQARERERVHS